MSDEKEYVDVSRLGAVAYTRPDGSNDYQNGFEDGVSFILDKVDNLPREKVAPVIHAHWIGVIHEKLSGCSNCSSYVEEEIDRVRAYFHFCPTCGAKMDE